MKKLVGLLAVLMLVLSSLAYAGGDQNHGSKGKGATGTTGGGSTTQTRGK